MKIYRCQHCKYTVTPNPNKKDGPVSARHKMGEHYEKVHKDLIPPDMDGYRWFYYLLTKKDHGSCVICHKETEFNNVTMKYARFCNNPLCKQKYKEERDRRMMNKYGKIYLLDDPEMQKKMQQGRRISGIYTWIDKSVQIPYLGSYELDFLRYLDMELKWPSSDILGPSPHTYVYLYNGEDHFYMPDFYIPSLNLEIEIKDDGSAKNINKESREKDVIKEDLMKSLVNLVDFIKITNKDYTKFNEIIKKEVS